MRYAALAPGKRFRPFLVLESASLFGVDEKAALAPASQELTAGSTLPASSRLTADVVIALRVLRAAKELGKIEGFQDVGLRL